MSYTTFYLKIAGSDETTIITLPNRTTFFQISATVLHLKLAYLNQVGEAEDNIHSLSFYYRGNKLNNLFMLNQFPTDVTIHMSRGHVTAPPGILWLPPDAETQQTIADGAQQLANK